MVRTLADLALRDGEAPGEALALRWAGTPEREYGYRQLRTDARKTGNALAHRGVRTGRILGVADVPVPESVLALLGGALLGAVVRFGPPREVDARAVVAPAERVGAYELPPGGQRIGYGSDPEDPAVAHFEEEMWSENPTFPPPDVDPADPVLATADGEFSHEAVIDATADFAGEIGEDDAVAVRAPLAKPGTIAAGIVAPLLAGATVLLPDPDDPDARGTVAVATGDPPEERWIDPRDVT